MRDLDEMLTMRHVPEVPTNLAERILDASLREPVRQMQGFERWVSAFFEGFVLPQPALAMAIVLVLGVLFGLSGESVSVLPALGTEDISLALASDDLFDTGDFL